MLEGSSTSLMQTSRKRFSPEYVLAMYDHLPENEDPTHLRFRSGQVIHVLNRNTDGWWNGELEGRQGLFPSNRVNSETTSSSFDRCNVAIYLKPPRDDAEDPCIMVPTWRGHYLVNFAVRPNHPNRQKGSSNNFDVNDGEDETRDRPRGRRLASLENLQSQEILLPELDVKTPSGNDYSLNFQSDIIHSNTSSTSPIYPYLSGIEKHPQKLTDLPPYTPTLGLRLSDESNYSKASSRTVSTDYGVVVHEAGTFSRFH